MGLSSVIFFSSLQFFCFKIPPNRPFKNQNFVLVSFAQLVWTLHSWYGQCIIYARSGHHQKKKTKISGFFFSSENGLLGGISGIFFFTRTKTKKKILRVNPKMTYIIEVKHY
jgi:glucose uptake protein GlcU